MRSAGLCGGFLASLLAAGWYSPLIYETSWYGPMLTGLSHLFWPTALLIGGWVGQWDPLTYWFRVAAAILANAVVYAGGFAAGRAVLRLPANR